MTPRTAAAINPSLRKTTHLSATPQQNQQDARVPNILTASPMFYCSDGTRKKQVGGFVCSKDCLVYQACAANEVVV